MVKSFRNNEKAEGAFDLIYVLVILLIIGLSVGIWVYGLYMDTQHSTAYDTVTKAERVVSKDGKSAQYLVWGNNETYAIRDSAINGRWNSSDLYGKIQVGHKYKFDCVSYRWDVISQYRNILSAEDITTPTVQTQIQSTKYNGTQTHSTKYNEKQEMANYEWVSE